MSHVNDRPPRPHDAPEPGELTKAEATLELERRRQLADAQGGPERVAVHQARGRLTARERVHALLDEGSFVEVGRLAHSDRAEVGERAPADAAVTRIGSSELLDPRSFAAARKPDNRRDRTRSRTACPRSVGPDRVRLDAGPIRPDDERALDARSRHAPAPFLSAP